MAFLVIYKLQLGWRYIKCIIENKLKNLIRTKWKKIKLIIINK